MLNQAINHILYGPIKSNISDISTCSTIQKCSTWGELLSIYYSKKSWQFLELYKFTLIFLQTENITVLSTQFSFKWIWISSDFYWKIWEACDRHCRGFNLVLSLFGKKYVPYELNVHSHGHLLDFISASPRDQWLSYLNPVALMGVQPLHADHCISIVICAAKSTWK